ncbi:siderophore-interacting protein [Brevundimonas sp. SL130]|uniref:siderophore-interacting protein n=1 Tax=Brevundimonas sp. SL130 TaxID=2995143 RepID=UPI00226D1D2F|nr:siderophore-interacting protein [Brevundimonas sp. SL130]WAC61298.1 siderophore-interacting protein [Brevundimonas sp. SL130]
MLPLKSRTLHDARVIGIEDITPRMRRISVAGDGLKDMPIDRPAMWMKLFFPIPSNIKPQGRAYTIRAYNAAQGWITFDFALHGDQGPAAWWIARVREGDTLQLAGPRSGYWIDPSQQEQVLIGDATALPAIAGIVERLSTGTRTRIFIEVADAGEEQVLVSPADMTIHWVHSGTAFPGTTGKLELVVQQADLPPDCQVFLAGEAFMVRAMRTHLLVDRGILHPSIDAKGYWRLGASDHREND